MSHAPFNFPTSLQQSSNDPLDWQANKWGGSTWEPGRTRIGSELCVCILMRHCLPEELDWEPSKPNLDVNTCWVCRRLLWGDIPHLLLRCENLMWQVIPPPCRSECRSWYFGATVHDSPSWHFGYWPSYLLAWLLPAWPQSKPPSWHSQRRVESSCLEDGEI